MNLFLIPMGNEVFDFHKYLYVYFDQELQNTLIKMWLLVIYLIQILI